MHPRRTDLLVPGLFDRLSEWHASYAAVPDCRELAAMLARSDSSCAPVAGYEATLWWLFDDGIERDTELPVGRVLGFKDGGTVMRADPVHIKPGISDAVLQEIDPRTLSATERGTLTAIINGALEEHQGRFELRADGAGYLSLPNVLSVHTTPPSVLDGRAIGRSLPRGGGASAAHRLFNLLQMALHDAPFNREREARGLPAVNSLWFWGCGTREAGLQCSYNALCAAEPLALALARACPAPPRILEALGSTVGSSGGDTLVVLEELKRASARDDVLGWGESLPVVVEHVQGLWRAGAREVRLFPCDGQVFHLRARDRWRFWRKIYTLAHWAAPR